MKKNMAKKLLSRQIFNLFLVVIFVLWVVSLKYLYDYSGKVFLMENKVNEMSMDKVDLDFINDEENEFTYYYDNADSSDDIKEYAV